MVAKNAVTGMPKLTKKLIDATGLVERSTHIWDDQIAGFCLKVAAGGRRTYLLKYRHGGGRSGRQRWLTLGVHGSITCEQARALALQATAAVARGEDPQDIRLSQRAAPTFNDLWERCETEHLPRKKLASAKEDKRKATLFLKPLLGMRKVEDIKRAEIQRLHQKFAHTPYEANRLLGLLSKIFNLAELWGFRSDHTNPCRLIPRFPEKSRERFLNVTEVARLNDAIVLALDENEISLDVAAAVRLLLLTGARVSEILGAEWSWVDWDRKVIALPDSKTGAKLIFLSEQAIVVLQHLQLRQGFKSHRYVIRGRLAGQAACQSFCTLGSIAKGLGSTRCETT